MCLMDKNKDRKVSEQRDAQPEEEKQTGANFKIEAMKNNLEVI